MRTNFQMTDQNITMVQGDTLSFNVIVKDETGEPVNVSQAHMIARKDIDLSYEPIFDAYLDHGITQEDGVLTVRIAPSMTGDFEGFCYYAMYIVIGTSPNHDTYTLLRGMIQIENKV